MPAADLDLFQLAAALRAVPILMAVGCDIVLRELVWLRLVLDRRLQYVLHGVIELLNLVLIQLVDLGPRVDPSLEQDLIGINIPNPCQVRLIHQGRLRHRPPALNRMFEGIQVEVRVKGIRSQVFVPDELINAVNHLQHAQLPLREISQLVAVGKVKQSAGVVWRIIPK